MRLYFGAALSPLEWIECALALLALAASLLRPGLGARWFASFEARLSLLAARPWLSALSAAALAVAFRLLLLPINPVPIPAVHDEFSMLLEADTFLHGRLANPPLPLWQHFETLYVISQPTYSSQYPPAQPALLALGRVLFGHPWAGVLLSVAAMCALAVWMLRAWLDPNWALVGGAVTALHLGVLSYWVDTYWGGPVPAAGGLLALGAAPRCLEGKWLRHALLAGAGLGVVFLCRPFEAGLLTVFLAVWLLVRLAPKPGPNAGGFLGRILAAGAALALFAAFQAYDNSRVTGSPWTFAYQVNQREYGTPQSFLFSTPVPSPAFRHKELRDEYLGQLRLYQRGRTPLGFLAKTLGMLRALWGLYFGGLLTLPLLFAFARPSSPALREAAALFGLFFVAHALYHAYYPHYDAPILGAILIILLSGWRRMRLWRPGGRDAGLALSRLLMAACAASPLILCAARMAGPALPGWQKWGPAVQAEMVRDNPRNRVVRCLESQPGPQLAIVHYRQPGHNPGGEWVYNSADLASSRLVMARDMGPEANRELEFSMPGRRVWLVEPDAAPPRLTPLSGQPPLTPGSCPGVR